MAVQRSSLRVAIITDWLFKIRGSEKVLDAVCEIFPNSEIFSLFGNQKEIYKLPNINGKKIHFSNLNKIPFISKFYRFTYPLWPITVESYKLDDYDLIFSISSSVAKGVIPKGTPHICYMNTPMRYAWDMRFQYFKKSKINFLIQPILHYLRIWDATRNNTIDYLIANSQFIKQRIFKYYGRKVDEVIYPFFNKSEIETKDIKKEDFYLYHGALEPNKGVLESVKSAVKYGFNLKVSGTGSLQKELKKIANGKDNIQFLGGVDDNTKYELMTKSKALLFPSIEDFGIVALEANSVGTPVLCLQKSGTSEIIKNGINGVVIDAQCKDKIYEGIQRLEKMKFNRNEIIKSTNSFSREIFQQKILKSVNTFLESSRSF